MFTWNFRFRLWPDKWRFKLLLGLTFIPLRAIDAFVHGWASLFHWWRHRRRRSRPNPRTLPGGHSRSRAAVLETWRGRMPLTWSLAGAHRSWRIRSALLAGRRSWRQSMFLPQTFLHNLLHCLPLLLRRFVLRRGYYRRNRGPDPRWGWNDSSALWRELRLRRLDRMRRCRLLHLWSERRRCRRWRRRWRCRNFGLWRRRLLFDFRFEFRLSFNLDSRRLRFNGSGLRRRWRCFDLWGLDGNDLVCNRSCFFGIGRIHPELPAQPIGQTIFNCV